MMFYYQFSLIFFWIIMGSIASVPIVLFRPKNPGNNGLVGFIMSYALTWSNIRLKVEGAEHINSHDPCIYLANHQSSFDVPIFGRLKFKNLTIIGKKELIWIPFFGLCFKLLGNLLIDRGNRSKAVAGLAQVVKAVKERQISVFVFPEGTRNKTPDHLLPFKKGAFYMAIEAQIPIVPIVVSDIRPLVNANTKYVRPGVITVRALPPISTQGMNSSQISELSDRVYQLMNDQYHQIKSLVDE